MIQVREFLYFFEKKTSFSVDDSDIESLKRKPSKKRQRYELEDEDFDITNAKNGDANFVPKRRRYVFINRLE